MTNNKPNDVRMVPAELLEELLDAAKWKAADFTKASPYRPKIDEVVRRTKDLLTQPVKAKVVLPERTTDTQSCSDIAKRIGLYGSVSVWTLGEIWNACLDEVAKLNEGRV